MTISRAMGGQSGGIPVNNEEAMGAIAPVKHAQNGVMKNEPIASGINIGKNSEPNPTRWNMMGRTTAQAAVRDAIII